MFLMLKKFHRNSTFFVNKKTHTRNYIFKFKKKRAGNLNGRFLTWSPCHGDHYVSYSLFVILSLSVDLVSHND